MMQGVGGILLNYAASVSDVDVWADAGSPTDAPGVYIIVASTVVISSSAPGVPAMDFSGFTAGTVVTLVNNGIIEGSGGAGAIGADWVVSHSGCGGGGAGDTAGPGGNGLGSDADGSPGTSGTSGVGGAAGVAGFDAPFDDGNGSDAQAGGDAILGGAVDFFITNGSGYILGGGGGGGSGDIRIDAPSDIADGGAGGNHGVAGAAAPSVSSPVYFGGNPGAGGYAIRYTTGSVTFESGSGSPNVEGTVGT